MSGISVALIGIKFDYNIPDNMKPSTKLLKGIGIFWCLWIPLALFFACCSPKISSKIVKVHVVDRIAVINFQNDIIKIKNHMDLTVTENDHVKVNYVDVNQKYGYGLICPTVSYIVGLELVDTGVPDSRSIVPPVF